MYQINLTLPRIRLVSNIRVHLYIYIYIYIYLEKEQVNGLEANLFHLKPMEGDFSIDDCS